MESSIVFAFNIKQLKILLMLFYSEQIGAFNQLSDN